MRRAAIALVVLSSLTASSSLAVSSRVEDALSDLQAAAGGAARIVRSEVTGNTTFFSTGAGRGVSVGGASPTERALVFLASYGRAFGVSSIHEVELQRSERDALGMDHVRYRQLHDGVPVAGGELAVHLRGGRVMVANAHTSSRLDGLSVQPTIDANLAGAAAAELVERRLRATGASFSAPRLEILDRGLLEGRSTPARLAWFVEATAFDLREWIWIDARSGIVLLHFSQLPEAKNRTVYNAASGSALPGTLVRSEGGPATGDADSDNAYDYAGATYDYYLAEHGRDSYDGAGAELRSSVDYCPGPPDPCPYPNAFWSGALNQMVYGDTFASADDVVAHELTHAVTERTAGLFYYMQSGALNESFSDIFGETVDLTDGLGNDAGGVRWLMGEDIPGGAIRNMSDPGAFSDPARVGDGNFKCYSNTSDAGGVHSNSGVPNHAYALMVDGGTYNSHTVTALGMTKAAKIEYRALTTYLLSAANFVDDAEALYQACMDLVGTSGITGGNCQEVRDATNAVEMASAPPCTPTEAAVPELCPAKQAPSDLFLADFETPGLPACSPSGLTVGWCDNSEGSVFGQFATSGTHSAWAYDPPSGHDITLTLTYVGGTLPAGARTQFNHAFGFDDFAGVYYDGGVIEYSTNGGTTWIDASSLIAAGMGYAGTLSSCCGNPLGGRSAFVKDSWGFTATQLGLGSLAGESFKIRWRLGSDNAFDDYGWFVDDIRLYTCAATSDIFSDGFESGNVGKWSSTAP